MRHQKTRHKLSRDSAHRKALLANLCKEIIQHERIKTSEAKAKAVKPEVEQLITLARKGDLHARRQALSILGQDKFTVHKLFEEVAPRYVDRPGGYTRILKLGPRRSRRDRDGLHRAGLARRPRCDRRLFGERPGGRFSTSRVRRAPSGAPFVVSATIPPVSIVKINAITVPRERFDEFAQRFATRAGKVSSAEGFESFQLLRPNDEREVCLVITQWRTEEDFDRVDEGPGLRSPGHAQHRTGGPVGTGSDGVGAFDVAGDRGPRRRSSESESRERAVMASIASARWTGAML